MVRIVVIAPGSEEPVPSPEDAPVPEPSTSTGGLGRPAEGKEDRWHYLMGALRATAIGLEIHKAEVTRLEAVRKGLLDELEAITVIEEQEATDA